MKAGEIGKIKFIVLGGNSLWVGNQRMDICWKVMIIKKEKGQETNDRTYTNVGSVVL